MIAIVGGGISGLAAAYELATRNVPFTLFEASARLGGLIRTEHLAGFTIEAGADSMLAQKRAALDLCTTLGLGPKLLTMKDPRTAFVLHHGRLHPLPSPSMFGIPTTWTGLARYSLLPPLARARIAIEPLLPDRQGGADESVAAFFRRRFGAATVDRLAQPLLGGIHAGSADRLSLPGLFPRLAEAEHSNQRVLRWMRLTTQMASAGGAFRSLVPGMGELVDAIRRRLPEDAVRLHSPALSLSRGATSWTLATPGSAFECSALILACPAPVVAALLRPLDAQASDLCAATPYVSTLSVALAWPRSAVAHPLAGSGFVVAPEASAVRITAGTWVSSKWDHRAPAGHVLLRAYMGGAHDPSAVDEDDEALIAIAVRDLSAILSISGRPELARVYRWRNAGAQHEVGHMARVRALEGRLSALPGLHVTGSGFRSIGIPDCVADGRAVAALAANASHASSSPRDQR
ncbi:protoporphyrinogen oxidase [soil metagenome]